jgi:hypothetical protein
MLISNVGCRIGTLSKRISELEVAVQSGVLALT